MGSKSSAQQKYQINLQQKSANTGQQNQTSLQQINHGVKKTRNETDSLQINDKTEQQCENTTKPEKCYDPLDPTLTFVEREDELDVLCIGYKSPRALMSCGHAVTPMSLTNHCRWLLDKGERRFVCGVFGCDAEWLFEEVCKMALLTPEENDDFQKQMLGNVKNLLDIKSCPGCNSCVMRENLNNLSVKCTVCTTEKNRSYIFCWQCLSEWKGPAPRSDRCENDGCTDLLETLRTCPEITFEDVEGVTGCPSIRACPTCGQILEHNTRNCKNITCPRCKVEFCFVCLKLTKECLETSYYFIPCSSGVAPRQTTIPVWKEMELEEILFGGNTTESET